MLAALALILALITGTFRQTEQSVNKVMSNAGNVSVPQGGSGRQGSAPSQGISPRIASTQFAGNISSAYSRLPHYARGTINHPGGRALVGERGPEIVDLPAGSRVYNANQSRQMMGNSNQPPMIQHITMKVNMDEVDEVYKLVDVFTDFAHNRTAYEGV